MQDLESTKATVNARAVVSWLLIVVGLAVWMSAQGYLTSAPLWARDLPPEADDSLAYLVRTQEMAQCFFQDCPALADLRQQMQIDQPTPEGVNQRELTSFPFPFYHPGFSLILLGITKFGVDLTRAYKILWGISPLLFGVGFALLLSAIWGKRAAGVALGLLALKIFPDNGLHYLTPANFAMGIALFMWARIIAREGDAPYTLIVGTPVLFSIHPIGGIYVLVSILLALLLSSRAGRKRIIISTCVICILVCISLFVSSVVHKPSVVNVLAGILVFPGFGEAIEGCLSNILGVMVGTVMLKDGLFGSLGLFLFSVAFGFLTAPGRSCRVAILFLSIMTFFLLGALYVSNTLFFPPADVFFRLWIPVVVILFGAIGNAICVAVPEGFRLLKAQLKEPGGWSTGGVQRLWPILAAALLLGYALDMALAGGEQIQTTIEHMTERQPLRFDPAQTSLLLSEAKPGDRVLYTSTISMAYYFLHGAMDLGAVYYHPAFAGSQIESEWLCRPDLKFAVAYNPTVYHPSLDGLNEKDRCITCPDYRYSPLSHRRKHGPINYEGYIRAADFRYIELEPRGGNPPASIIVRIKNPGMASWLELMDLDSGEKPITGPNAKLTVPAKWTGILRFDIREDRAPRYRLLLPPAQDFLIEGISFDSEVLHWPWGQKTLITFSARDPETGDVELSFDPADLLPAPLRNLSTTATVLADGGASVLLQIEKQPTQ